MRKARYKVIYLTLYRSNCITAAESGVIRVVDFTDREVEFLKGQRLWRLATVSSGWGREFLTTICRSTKLESRTVWPGLEYV